VNTDERGDDHEPTRFTDFCMFAELGTYSMVRLGKYIEEALITYVSMRLISLSANLRKAKFPTCLAYTFISESFNDQPRLRNPWSAIRYTTNPYPSGLIPPADQEAGSSTQRARRKGRAANSFSAGDTISQSRLPQRTPDTSKHVLHP